MPKKKRLRPRESLSVEKSPVPGPYQITSHMRAGSGIWGADCLEHFMRIEPGILGRADDIDEIWKRRIAMYNSDTELLFPLRVIPTLADLKGEVWKKLILQVSAQDAPLAEQLAFVHLMVKLSGCITCNADSFRAMRGCSQCSRQTVRRFRGSDQEMVELFKQSLKEVEGYLTRCTVSAQASNE